MNVVHGFSAVDEEETDFLTIERSLVVPAIDVFTRPVPVGGLVVEQSNVASLRVADMDDLPTAQEAYKSSPSPLISRLEG